MSARDGGVEDAYEAFRSTVRAFIEREVAPHHAQWERDGIVSRDAWRAAGEAGLLGFFVDPEHGGLGIDDFHYNAILATELARGGYSGLALSLHNDIVGPYLVRLGNDDQRARWLPGFCSGETIGAIAMTEPGAGSDLQGITTRAVDKGDHWVLNGSKTFISNGILADLVVVVARTDPDAGARGLSLFVVTEGMTGFSRGRNLDKLGQHAQDTAELHFHDVEVPRENLLGEPGGGFAALMDNLPAERLSIAVAAVAGAERALDLTLEHVRERTAFGTPIGSFQANRFTLAELATEVRIARVFLDDCVDRHAAGDLDTVTASMAKWWTTELQQRVVDRGLQLHGGYGYMTEYPIARAWVDSRVQTIYGGTTEIMKEIVGRSLGL